MSESEEDYQPNLIGDQFSDESADEDDVEDQHEHLLKSIKALTQSKDESVTERTNGAADISEFGFTKYGQKFKVDVQDIVKGLNSSTKSNKIKKTVRSIEQVKVEDTPLPKIQQDRINRNVAYKSTTEELSKWQPLIQKNRKEEQLIFPLLQPNYSLKTSEEFCKKFQARTPLEKEIAMLLHGSDNVETNTKMLTKAEEKALKAMNLEEAQERRAELMKFRALMTYSEAKFRRQKKIKSKRFRKILKKERLKKEEKELDVLQKTDPESYLEKIEVAEKSRVEERMTLKHRGGSKFARKKMLYARYDPVARQAVQDMIDKNKELTKKQYVSSSDDDESDGGISVDEETQLEMLSSAMDNPWMKAPTKPEKFVRPKALQQNSSKNAEEDSDSDDNIVGSYRDLAKQDIDILELEAKRLKKRKQNDDDAANESMDSGVKLSHEDEDLEKRLTEIEENSSGSKHKNVKITEETEEDTQDIEDDKEDIDELFNVLEDIEKINNKKKTSAKNKKKPRKGTAKLETEKSEQILKNSEIEQDLRDDTLSQTTTRKRTLEEFEGNWNKEETVAVKIKKKSDSSNKTSKSKQTSVDPKKLFTMKPDVIESKEKTELITNADDEDALDDEDDQRMTIAQAFADDDVVQEFKLEKKDIAEEDKPKDINLALPGWGEWGGEGIVLSSKKKKKFTLKKKGKERKDAKLGNVILNEKRDAAVAEHQVKDLPRQFLNAKQFEQSISQPIGNTWNPEKAFHRMIQPKVVTQRGAIIKPMDKEEMFKKQKVNRKSGGDFDKGRSDKSLAVTKTKKPQKNKK